MMKCALCGFCYSEQEAQKSCSHCLVTKGCKLVRCPNCGFETPPEPRWLTYIRDRFSRSHFLLTDLETNRESEIVSIQTRDPKKLQKLIALGLFPGVKLTLIQKFPSYTFQMGHSQFVVDRELAECICVGRRDEFFGANS